MEKLKTGFVKQIMSPPFEIDVVMLDFQSQDIFRCPVVALSLVEWKSTVGDIENDIVPITWVSGDETFDDGVAEDVRGNNNFLGLEFKGKKKNWQSSIDRKLKEEEKRKNAHSN